MFKNPSKIVKIPLTFRQNVQKSSKNPQESFKNPSKIVKIPLKFRKNVQ